MLSVCRGDDTPGNPKYFRENIPKHSAAVQTCLIPLNTTLQRGWGWGVRVELTVNRFSVNFL